MSAIVTQFGVGSAFLLGLYDGTFTFEQLAEHGDFGHGTFNAVAGEMIALDGQFYRVEVSGTVTKVSPEECTPLATVTKFAPDTVIRFTGVRDYQSFQEKIRQQLSSDNIVFAMKIEGTFNKLLARSESAQPKPYEPLNISIPKTQRTFTFENTPGTLVGYFVPELFRQLILPGFHFHYINEARDQGGHVFDFSFDEAAIYLQACREVRILLPDLAEFDTMDLNQDFEHALQVAERGLEAIK